MPKISQIGIGAENYDVNDVYAVPKADVIDNLVTQETGKPLSAAQGALLKDTIGYDNAGSHNAVYRGKDITADFNSGKMSTNIANGTFVDIYPGDYIVKTVIIDGTTYNNAEWVILGCDTHYNTGDTALTVHHVAVTPRTKLGTAQMNASNVTTGGYKSSAMWTSVIPKYVTGIKNAFGASHIQTFRDYITNAVDSARYNRYGQNSGAVSNGEWVSVTCIQMTVPQVFGFIGFASSGYDTINPSGSQFPAFRHDPSLINYNRNNWWLRDVATSTNFCIATNYGYTYNHSASNSICVRPLFLLI